MPAKLLLSISFVLAYFLGSLPFSYWAGMLLKGIDIRKHGSKNAGATNAVRVLGLKIGLPVLLLDIAKGVAAVLIGKYIINEAGFNQNLIVITGFVAILGHVTSPFLKFKGGKGVATATGVFAALTPFSFLIAFGVFVVMLLLFRYVSLASISAVTVLFFSELFRGVKTEYSNLTILILTFVIALVIIIRHKANIYRLINKTEKKIF